MSAVCVVSVSRTGDAVTIEPTVARAWELLIPESIDVDDNRR